MTLQTACAGADAIRPTCWKCGPFIAKPACVYGFIPTAESASAPSRFQVKCASILARTEPVAARRKLR